MLDSWMPAPSPRLQESPSSDLEPGNLPTQWECLKRGGPVLATAVHMGHVISDDLKPYLYAADADLRRDEDPMTGVWVGVGDDVFRTYNSRFFVDLNRPRDKAFSANPEDTWGVRIYRERPPESIVERSLCEHDRFYELMRDWIEGSIRRHGKLLVLDFHSYNYRRNKDQKPDPPARNPDIDLGVTTLNHDRFGSVAETLLESLSGNTVCGRTIDVRTNVRYPDGGHFPEWVFENYGDDVCTITLEVKKFYMDEVDGMASLQAIDDLFLATREATEAAKKELSCCR